MNISILDDYHDVVRTLSCYKKVAGHDITIWKDHTDDVDVLAKRLENTEVLVTIRERTAIRAPLLRRLKKLKLISQHGSFPHIDVPACTECGVLVCSDLSPARPSYATAEVTWGLIISVLRNIPAQAAALKNGQWQLGLGTGLRGKVLGVYGYGRIGKVVANIGKAFGMRVLIWGREASRTLAAADGYETAASREAFFSDCDVITLHLKLVAPTRGIVTAADLARMKTTALLVNTSRAGLIEPDALVNALKAGRPGKAAVDVYEQEPVVNAGHPLLAMDNTFCTPHIGYVEWDAYEFQFGNVFSQIVAYQEGKPIHMANPEVLSKAVR